jgi:predicted nucleic-acid-binding Zn-ribbon protein
MGRFGRAFKRAGKALVATVGPGQYAAGGHLVVCPQCGGETFEEGKAQLNTSGMSLLNLDWANRSATTLACSHCGRIQWFLKHPERIVNVED